MKKFLSALIILLFCLSLPIVAFADDSEPQTPNVIVSFDGDGIFTVPEEAPLTAEASQNADNPGTEMISFDPPKAVTDLNGYKVPIHFPAYTHVGIYSYTIRQTAGTAQGVTYDTDPIDFLVLAQYDTDGTIIVGDSGMKANEQNKKKASFENVCRFGSLSVSNTVRGSTGDLNKEFSISVTLTLPEGETTVQNTISYQIDNGEAISILPSSWTGKVCTVSIPLKNGQTATFSNIPTGINYTVGVENPSGYSSNISNDEGLIGTDTPTTEINFSSAVSITTGLILNNAPYLITLAVAAGGLVLFILRRYRKHH